MKTYGDLRFRLRRLHPSVDLVLLDGWMMDRYQQILDRLDWQRLREIVALQTMQPYSAGTITATAGSVYVTGSATAWTDAHHGRMIRIAARGEYYAFAPNSNTTAQLDRPYEGETGADLPYVISQAVYPVAASCRLIQRVTIPHLGRTLERPPIPLPPGRPAAGAPLYWDWYMDDASGAPQIELYPVPDQVYGVVVEQVAEAGGLSEGDTSTTLLPWVRPAALIAGVAADVLRWQKDDVGAERMERRFEDLIRDMVRTEAFRRGGVRLRMAGGRHRAHRWQR